MNGATVAAPADLTPAEAPYLRAPRVPADLAPIATWDRRSLLCTVREGATVSTWSGVVRYVDARPGPRGYELVDVECESVVPEGEPSEAARECAETELADRADEIGRAR